MRGVEIIIICCYDSEKKKLKIECRKESAALGRRIPWANRLFSKSMEWKILNFLHEFEKNDFGNLCSSLIEKLGFSFLKKKDLSFKIQK